MTKLVDMNRRSFCKTLAAAVTLPIATSCATSGFAAEIETSSFEFIGVRDPQLGAQLAIADHYGLFKEQGLDVSVRWTQSGADTLTIMGGGAANIGVAGIFAQVVLSGQKLPVRTISSLADMAETQGFVLSPGVKLLHPRELEGKRIAHTQGNSQIMLLAKLAQLYGFDHSKVELVNMNQSEGVVAASKGDVDGLLGFQPNLYRLVQMGGTLYVTGATLYVNGKAEPRPADDLLLANHSVLLASQDWIDKKPNTLAAALRALAAANKMLSDDRAKAMAALKVVLKIDENALNVMVNANKYELGITPALEASLKFQSEWARSIGRISAGPATSDCFSTKVAQLVDPALVTWKSPR
jgi:ABC-type nitrate/sulfonate/bicarbonate transport system substrate-binding protein